LQCGATIAPLGRRASPCLLRAAQGRETPGFEVARREAGEIRWRNAGELIHEFIHDEPRNHGSSRVLTQG